MPISKLQSNRKFLAGMIFFLVFLGLFIFINNPSEAAENFICQRKYAPGGGITTYSQKGEFSSYNTKESCEALNNSPGLKNTTYSWVSESDALKNQSRSSYAGSTDKQKSNCGISSFNNIVICFLEPVLFLVRIILIAATALFGWILKPDNATLILNGGLNSSDGAVYYGWTLLRDVLNLVFILILLFSAFCTIFQVDRYNYKKILLILVLMALLVNFSYPIARFIIDVSNVMMYSLINSLFSADPSGIAITLDFAKNGEINRLLNTSYTSAGIMLTAIIFLFIFAITIFAIAILLLVRLIALAIIIITSPIGFVGNIMPGFQNYASQWWDNLFRYSFFGPIVMLALLLSLKMMTKLSEAGAFSGIQTSVQEAGKSLDPNIFGTVAFMMIPIILLWGSVSLAQKMSVTGAGAITGKAQKVMQGAGKKFSGYDWSKNAYGKYSAERKKRKDILDKTAWSSKLGSYAGSKPGEWRDRAQGALRKGDKWYQGIPGSKDARTRMGETLKRDIAETRKGWKDTGVSEAELAKALSGGSLAQKRAAALEMAEKRGFGSGDDAKKNYKLAIDALEGDKISQEIFNDKVKEKHVKLVMDYEIGQGIRTEPQAYTEYIDKMNADQLSKQKGLLSDKSFIDNYLRNRGDSDPKFIEEVAKKMSQADRNKWIEENLIQNEGGNSRGRAGFV